MFHNLSSVDLHLDDGCQGCSSAASSVPRKRARILAKAVSRGVERALVSCDLPHPSVEAARRLADDGGADVVKVEGLDSVQAIVAAGIPVFAQLTTPSNSLLQASGTAEPRRTETRNSLLQAAAGARIPPSADLSPQAAAALVTDCYLGSSEAPYD